MSDYKMDIRGALGLGEYSDIHDYMGIVDKNDNFTITLDTKNKQHISIITSMLKENDFNSLIIYTLKSYSHSRSHFSYNESNSV